MFELDEKVLESIIFSMENQETVFYVDIETGELSSRPPDPEGMDESGPEDIARYEAIPEWNSQDGFRLMEQFSQNIGHPVARAELLAALARGRGVFRAFKNALDSHPEVEKKWYEYKARAMKARIVGWYEDLRDAHGLTRLGLEPEDTDDLLLSDFQIKLYGPEKWKELEFVVQASKEEALGSFPEVLVEYEFDRLARELEGGSAGEFSIYAAECEPGTYPGIAVVRTLFAAERAFCKLLFLYVDPGRRRIGLGRRLAEFARERSDQAGIQYFVVDSPFLWQEFGASLEDLGYKPFGTHWLSVSNA